jgi:hypothetical protein
MLSPLNARPESPDKIRAQVMTLRNEINSIRNRRDGAIRALSDRRQKLARLEAQLALCGGSARALHQPQLCPA